MASSLFGEDRGEQRIFRRKDNLGFGSFGSYCKFRGGGEASNHQKSERSKVKAITDDSLNGLEFPCSIDESKLFFPLIIFRKARVSDGIYINMARGSGEGSAGRVVSFDIDFVGDEKESGFVDRFVDEESLISPVDNQVSDIKPGKSEDDIVF